MEMKENVSVRFHFRRCSSPANLDEQRAVGDEHTTSGRVIYSFKCGLHSTALCVQVGDPAVFYESFPFHKHCALADEPVTRPKKSLQFS